MSTHSEIKERYMMSFSKKIKIGYFCQKEVLYQLSN